MREGISHVSPFTSHDAILNLPYSISTLYLGFSAFFFSTLNWSPLGPEPQLALRTYPNCPGLSRWRRSLQIPKKAICSCVCSNDHRSQIGPLHGFPSHMSQPAGPYIPDTNAPRWCYPELYTHPRHPPEITCLTYAAGDNDHVSKPAR